MNPWAAGLPFTLVLCKGPEAIPVATRNKAIIFSVRADRSSFFTHVAWHCHSDECVCRLNKFTDLLVPRAMARARTKSITCWMRVGGVIFRSLPLTHCLSILQSCSILGNTMNLVTKQEFFIWGAVESGEPIVFRDRDQMTLQTKNDESLETVETKTWSYSSRV